MRFDTKKWYESKTIWGSIVTIAASVAGMFGHPIDEATQANIMTNITSAITAIGGLWTMFGRIAADKRIG